MKAINNKKSLTKRYGDNKEITRKEASQSDIEKARFIIAMAGVAVIMFLVVTAWNMGKKHVPLEDYVVVNFTGANGYAVPGYEIKKEELVDMLVRADKNTDKEAIYKRFVDSIAASVTYDMEEHPDGISNGDKIQVKVSYDKAIAKEAGLSVSNGTFNVRAKGIQSGTYIDLFQNIEVVFAGISPDAYVVVKNNWNEEFLAALDYIADKPEGIMVGDEVTLTCVTDKVSLGRKGYVTDNFSHTYKADKLSSYVKDVKQIDMGVINNLISGCKKTIVDETADTTFRMMYKATKDKKYLHEANNESAENIVFMEGKLLKRKAGENVADDNKIVLLFTADLLCGGETSEVYFAFVFPNGYITCNNEFNVAFTDYSELYYCNVNIDEMMDEIMGIDSDNSHDSAGENGDDISKAELEEHSHDDLPYDIWGFMPDN